MYIFPLVCKENMRPESGHLYLELSLRLYSPDCVDSYKESVVNYIAFNYIHVQSDQNYALTRIVRLNTSI